MPIVAMPAPEFQSGKSNIRKEDLSFEVVFDPPLSAGTFTLYVKAVSDKEKELPGVVDKNPKGFKFNVSPEMEGEVEWLAIVT